MNMIDVQDKLKGLSQQQLVSEMQSPSGVAPQFLVLSEITRRKRMQDSYQAQQQQPTSTIAEEAVASAGVPGGGLAAMARSMAPNSSMAQNTAAMPQPLPQEKPVQGMYGGGYVQKMAGGGQPPNMSNPMVSAWVQREAQRRGVTVEEVLANLGPTGAAISAAAPSMDARNQMLGLEPVGPSSFNFPTQSDLDQRYADAQRGDTFRMPSQSDLDLRYQDAQGQQPIFPNSGFSPDPADTLAPMLDRIQNRTRMTANEPPSYVDLDLTSEPAADASTPDTVRGIDPYTGKFIDVPTPGKMLSDAGQGISDAASYVWDSIGTYRGDPYSELSEAEMADLQSGKMSPEEADRLQSSRLALADIGATELQNPALRPSVQPTAPAGETPKPPPPPKDTTPQGGGISTDTAGVPATPNPATSAAGRGSGAAVGGANAPTSYEQELRDAMGRAEKRANQDKWLALAQVGMQLMSSKEPTLGGALGEAGIAGLEAFRGSRDEYEQERLGLSKAMFDLQQQQAAAIAAQRAAGARAAGKPKTALDEVDRLKKLRDALYVTTTNEFGEEVSTPLDQTAIDQINEEIRRIASSEAAPRM
jgi:hypothetical protein